MQTLLLFGSSLARDLNDFDTVKIHTIAGRKVRFVYRFFPGRFFEYFLIPKKRYLINTVLKCKPDFVCVIFGGNSINWEVKWDDVLDSCKAFFGLLYERFMSINPEGKIIASQVLLRFNRNPDNVHKCPDPIVYKSFRNLINRKLNKLRTKHHMMIVAGPNNLDDETLFRDGTHLKLCGLHKQFAILKRTLAHIIVSNA